MCIVALLRLTLGAVLWPEPDVERMFMYPKITGRLGHGLIRLDR